MKWFWSMTMQNNTVNSHYYRNPQGGGRFSVRNSGGTREKLIDLSLNIWNNMKLKKDKVSKVASLTIKRSGRTQFKNGSFTFFYRNVDFCYVSQDRGRSIWVSTIARKKNQMSHCGRGMKLSTLTIKQNRTKPVHESLPWQTIKPNTYNTVRETLTWQTIQQNTEKTVHETQT